MLWGVFLLVYRFASFVMFPVFMIIVYSFYNKKTHVESEKQH